MDVHLLEASLLIGSTTHTESNVVERAVRVAVVPERGSTEAAAAVPAAAAENAIAISGVR